MLATKWKPASRTVPPRSPRSGDNLNNQAIPGHYEFRTLRTNRVILLLPFVYLVNTRNTKTKKTTQTFYVWVKGARQWEAKRLSSLHTKLLDMVLITEGSYSQCENGARLIRRCQTPQLLNVSSHACDSTSLAFNPLRAEPFTKDIYAHDYVHHKDKAKTYIYIHI